MKDGKLQVAINNDAALDIDLTAEGDGWQTVKDDSGKPIKVSVDEEITFVSKTNIQRCYAWRRWEDVKIECESEQLKEFALFAGEPNAYCYIASNDGEYFPICGGYWGSGAYAGVFYTYLGHARSLSSTEIGFRSAYFKKKGEANP